MSTSDGKITRRAALVRSAEAAAFAAGVSNLQPLFAAEASRWFKIGACEWSLGRRDPSSFEVAKQIGNAVPCLLARHIASTVRKMILSYERRKHSARRKAATVGS